MVKNLPKKQGLYDPAYEHDSCGIGFVANIKGERSYNIIERGLEVLERMAHRGAESADNRTGDGAGILLQIPHKLYKRDIPTLPELGRYGTGILFLPQELSEASICIEPLEKIIDYEGFQIVAWRQVKIAHSHIAALPRASPPTIRQTFLVSKTDFS